MYIKYCVYNLPSSSLALGPYNWKLPICQDMSRRVGSAASCSLQPLAARGSATSSIGIYIGDSQKMAIPMGKLMIKHDKA